MALYFRMTKDCSEEFKQLGPKIGLFWVAYLSYLVFVVFAIETTRGLINWGSLEFYLLFVVLVLGMFIVLKLFSPRCPNCGQGIYSIVEIKGFPIAVKNWASKNCGGCGAKFKT